MELIGKNTLTSWSISDVGCLQVKGQFPENSLRSCSSWRKDSVVSKVSRLQLSIMPNQPAFGGMLQQLVSLGILGFHPEPLNGAWNRPLEQTDSCDHWTLPGHQPPDSLTALPLMFFASCVRVSSAYA
jgi:hypothetical protein